MDFIPPPENTPKTLISRKCEQSGFFPLGFSATQANFPQGLYRLKRYRIGISFIKENGIWEYPAVLFSHVHPYPQH